MNTQGFLVADPQLDANFLIKLSAGVPEFVAYAVAQQAAGLRYNEVTQGEFLAAGHGNVGQLQQLEQQYGLELIKDVPLPDLNAAAIRLQAAF